MLIKQICLENITEIASLEQKVPSPWNAEQIAAEIKNSLSRQIIIVDYETEMIRGWSCYRILPPEAELLKITVHPDFRRKKAGTFMLQHIMQDCINRNCSDLFLEVREKNDRAQHFYLSHSFQKVAVRKNYYSDPSDNGIIYQKAL